MKKILFVELVVVIVFSQSIFAQGIKVPVKVVPVLTQDISSSVKAIGSIKPKEQIIFSTKIMATIKQIMAAHLRVLRDIIYLLFEMWL